MEGSIFQVKVSNAPQSTKKYVVARYDINTSEMWYWGSWDDKNQAIEISKVVDGVVVERMD